MQSIFSVKSVQSFIKSNHSTVKLIDPQGPRCQAVKPILPSNRRFAPPAFANFVGTDFKWKWRVPELHAGYNNDVCEGDVSPKRFELICLVYSLVYYFPVEENGKHEINTYFFWQWYIFLNSLLQNHSKSFFIFINVIIITI